jgi:hypothetical protein
MTQNPMTSVSILHDSISKHKLRSFENYSEKSLIICPEKYPMRSETETCQDRNFSGRFSGILKCLNDKH